jgi:CIC family chloride channel protein
MVDPALLPAPAREPVPAAGAARVPGVGAAALLWSAAVLVGILAALATLAFHALIGVVETVATGQGGSLVAAAMRLPPWRRALVGAAGGVGAGLVLLWGMRWAAHGPAGAKNLDYIDAARRGNYLLNDRTTFVRSLSALVSVGTGAPIGREGPMVQLSAWFASWTARILPLPDEYRNALLVCGVAAGIGSAYHAPIAGVVFVLELALGFLARHTVAPVLISAATSSALIYWLVAPQPLYVMPALPLLPSNLWMGIAVGVACGGFGTVLLNLLERSRAAFGRIASAPLRLGLGGIFVGLISAAVPEVWGNGYSVVSRVLGGDSDWTWVAVILLAKVGATVLSSGSGAIGGVFTPTLFVGATSGYVIANWVARIDPALVGDPRATAVIGMAAVLAAVTQAPLMAIVMVLEMTQQFQLTLPVMLACGIAYGISSHLGVSPLYGNPIEGHR